MWIKLYILPAYIYNYCITLTILYKYKLPYCAWITSNTMTITTSKESMLSSSWVYCIMLIIYPSYSSDIKITLRYIYPRIFIRCNCNWQWSVMVRTISYTLPIISISYNTFSINRPLWWPIRVRRTVMR